MSWRQDSQALLEWGWGLCGHSLQCWAYRLVSSSLRLTGQTGLFGSPWCQGPRVMKVVLRARSDGSRTGLGSQYLQSISLPSGSAWLQCPDIGFLLGSAPWIGIMSKEDLSSFSLSFSLQFIFTSSGHLQYLFLLVDLGSLKIVYLNILSFIVSFLACILDPRDYNPVYLLIGRMIFHHNFLCSIQIPLFPDSDHNGLETIDFISLGCIPMGCCFSLLLLLLGQVNLYFFNLINGLERRILPHGAQRRIRVMPGNSKSRTSRCATFCSDPVHQGPQAFLSQPQDCVVSRLYLKQIDRTRFEKKSSVSYVHFNTTWMLIVSQPKVKGRTWSPRTRTGRFLVLTHRLWGEGEPQHLDLKVEVEPHYQHISKKWTPYLDINEKAEEQIPFSTWTLWKEAWWDATRPWIRIGSVEMKTNNSQEFQYGGMLGGYKVDPHVSCSPEVWPGFLQDTLWVWSSHPIAAGVCLICSLSLTIRDTFTPSRRHHSVSREALFREGNRDRLYLHSQQLLEGSCFSRTPEKQRSSLSPSLHSLPFSWHSKYQKPPRAMKSVQLSFWISLL